MRRAGAERQAINAPLQGAAADIIKRAMIKIPQILKKHKIDAELILQVHDELIFECAEIEADRLIPIIKSIMVNAPNPSFKMTVPLEVEAGVGNNWDEAH